MSSSGTGDDGGLDLAALERAGQALDASEPGRGAAHVAQLKAVLGMHHVLRRAGLSLSSPAEIALRLRCSEHRANDLLTDASMLADLPGAFDLLASGVLSVEQSRTLCQQLGVLDDVLQLELWERIAKRLQADREQGIVRPPARLAELLRKLVIELDPAGAIERRRQAETDGKVDYRRREDGLADIDLLGIPAPDAQAVLQRIQQASAPVGHSDERTADKRRLDAAVDLLLGRASLPFDGEQGHCRPGCGCTVGSPVPCGTDVHLMVPVGGALGTTDETAELVGHGPIEPDLLAQILLNAPRIWPVWVDEHGVPLAVADRPITPPRGDHTAVRQALLTAMSSPPPPPQPRHPLDHPPPDRPPPTDDEQLLAAAALTAGAPATGHPHPTGYPGPYRVPRRMRRLLQIRRPRCEFPGCGARATRCDLDHDLAWPDGPTCPCNLGALCRRHHRVKQQGWKKARHTTGVDWTDPTGHSWPSPTPHDAPQLATRPLPPLPRPWDDFDQLSPLDQEAELHPPADLDDPAAYELRAVDHDPDDDDLTGQRLHAGHTRWTLDLPDPYAWT